MGGETRFAYFPAATVSDGTATAVSVQATADPAITQAGGEGKRQKSPGGKSDSESIAFNDYLRNTGALLGFHYFHKKYIFIFRRLSVKIQASFT